MQAIESTRRERTYVDPSVGARLATEPTDDDHPDGLSDREVEVLRLVALGYTNAQIAEQLFISIRTVETHRAHILQKTGINVRSELVRYAYENGLVTGPA